MNKLIAFAVVALLASSGCAVRVVRPASENAPLPPPPPMTSVAQRMSYDEAVRTAVAYASQRGYSSRVKEAHLTGNDIWKVKLDVIRSDARGKLHLDLDAYSRNIIRAQEHVKYLKQKPGKSHRASAVAFNDDFEDD